ncbi:protein spire homolog 1-like [Lytechinus variegatus]|uniref:protein spire homolog 1-like n=1 Tax=Lytechinus variegatus TaxID=7654 RepID=UPI001BB0D819|nr:protein spire homolog 1-like [Lytechinus variegatus]
MEDDKAKGKLNSEQEIISLQDILESFSAPLNEEQAWAICYQCGKFLDESVNGNVTVQSANGVLLSKDGTVRLPVAEEQEQLTDNKEREDHTRETQLMVINTLGRIIYHALDYGLSEEEERELSRPLEELIEFMTSADIHDNAENSNDNNNIRHEADNFNVDEGIEDEGLCEEEETEDRGRLNDESDRDDHLHSENDSCIITQLLKMCSDHLPQPKAASTHYQAVCRAVYTEYLDLATFLNKITGSNEILRSLSEGNDMSDGNVEDLHPRQWAKIWLNVVRDLRNGVKLKKLADHEKGRAPIEYALTPYEMLMDDIRSHRFTLNKVMVNGSIPPRVKKEAHDIILDFIRSRPPLKPVPLDKLNQTPLRRESVHEKIMKEIRSQPQLRPTVLIEKSNRRSLGFIFSDEELSPPLPKKVIKAEFTLDWSETESESDSSIHEPNSYSRQRRLRKGNNVCQETQYNDDDEMDGDAGDVLEQAIQRILDDGQHLPDESLFLNISMPPDTMVSTPEKTLTMSRSSLSSFDEIRSDEIPLDTPRRHSIGPCQSFKSPGRMSQDTDCLSLTVEEVIHIRSVLVKAEIENLRVNPKLHKDVLQDKVCFSCKKKFSLFKKKFKCRLCKKLICSVCCIKMYIPTEEFLHIPVDSLSPNSPKKSPSVPTRKRSISEPPTPFMETSPVRERKQRELHVWRQPSSPMENVCCECCTFLKNTRTGPPPQNARGLPVPFSLASPPPLYTT